MVASPAVRIRAAQDLMDLLDSFEAGSQARIRARLPEALLQALDSAVGLGWIPIEVDRFLPESILTEFGHARSRELFRCTIPAMIERPLLEPLVSGMLRVLGENRRKIIKVIPRGWGFVFRDFCVPTLGTADDSEIEVLFNEIAPEVRECPAYMDIWEGVCEGALGIADPAGSLDFKVAADRSHARATFRFKPGAP